MKLWAKPAGCLPVRIAHPSGLTTRSSEGRCVVNGASLPKALLWASLGVSGHGLGRSSGPLREALCGAVGAARCDPKGWSWLALGRGLGSATRAAR